MSQVARLVGIGEATRSSFGAFEGLLNVEIPCILNYCIDTERYLKI